MEHFMWHQQTKQEKKIEKEDCEAKSPTTIYYQPQTICTSIEKKEKENKTLYLYKLT
jgi:hypothetical protein